jgi:hypothetical protein
MREAVPEDPLRRFGIKRGELVAATRGDEVNLVVDEPVFEPVSVLEPRRATSRQTTNGLGYECGF